MISAYISGGGFLHRLPAGAKLAGLALTSLALLPVSDWRVMGVVLVAVVALYLPLGRAVLPTFKGLRPLLVLAALLLAFHIYLGTAEAGWLAVLRLFAMVLMATLVTLTTRMQDMLDALTPALGPLKVVGLKPQRLALAVTLVIRFTPLLVGLGLVLGEAHLARTGRRGNLRLVAPIAIQALRTADRVAEAIAARGGVDGVPPEARPRGDGPLRRAGPDDEDT